MAAVTLTQNNVISINGSCDVYFRLFLCAGVNAIWISPVVDQTDGGYHGYWAKNLNAINSHFGSEDDLKQLVQKCHEKDIWVMVDV